MLSGGVDEFAFAWSGQRSCDVSCALQADLDAGRTTSQYRVRFSGSATDDDLWDEYVDFFGTLDLLVEYD